jgi:ABC-type bacteriocin/lantibiotic exporter with double-glycine peptidase domain
MTTKSSFQKFFKVLKVEKEDILSIYIFAIFQGLIGLSLPIGIQAIINLISGGQISTSWIVLVIIVIGGIAFSGIMQIMQLRISENIQQKIFAKSAFEFSYRIPKIKLENIRGQYMPELVNRFFDTINLQKGLSKILLDFSTSSLQVIFGLILLSLYHPFFIIFSLTLLLMIILIFRFTAPVGLRTSLVNSKDKYEVVHWLEEVARSMDTFKLAGKSNLHMKKTDERVSKYIHSRNKHFNSLLTQFITLVFFKVLIAAALLIMGGLLVINEQMNIGQFVAAEIVIIMVLASVEKLILSMETIYTVLTSLEKLASVLNLKLEDDWKNSSRDFDKSLSIELNNLNYSFSEGNSDAINNINLKINHGEKICISGGEGAGKSVLIQLLAGIYDDYIGSIYFNEIPLSNWRKEDLWNVMGDNISKEDIFKGSIFENISLGNPDINLDQIKHVIKIVGLEDYLKSLPDGYYTQLLPEGKNLNRSVKMKIILARSIVGEKKIHLIEDSLNSLSGKDKKSIVDFILSQDSTSIVISNDKEIASKFERNIVMEKGFIIGDGPISVHENKPWYSQVFKNI